MNKEDLIGHIKNKKSFLCISLDADVRRIPNTLLDEEDPIFSFNKRVIDSTAEYVIAYKFNTIYYQNIGAFGIKAMEKTICYLRDRYPDIFIIADAKCTEVGENAEIYIRNFFDHLKVDALTILPYLGTDIFKSMLTYPDKWSVVLSLTSNESNKDFQLLKDEQGEYLFERFIRMGKMFSSEIPIMFSVSTQNCQIYERLRLSIPDDFIFINYNGKTMNMYDICSVVLNKDCCTIISLSKDLIYCDDSDVFESKISKIVMDLRQQMSEILLNKEIISE